MIAPRVGVVHIDAANYASISGALERLGVSVTFIKSPEDFSRVNAIVFPGVAHFGFLVRRLDEAQLRAPLVDALERGMPFLGICAGMQLLFEGSAEAPDARGLGYFEGTVQRLSGAKLPHIGWNFVSPLVQDVAAGWAYFANSYAAPATTRQTVAISEHGGAFSSIVRANNVFGVQFHPERSAAYGTGMLREFLTSVT